MIKLGIMQPYFLPYIAYWQLIKTVDLFVVYDNIEYTKKGWINRNKFLQKGKGVYFTVPLKNDSDYLHVRNRLIADTFEKDKLLNQIRAAYQKAPFYNEAFPIFTAIIENEQPNLFDFIYFSIMRVCTYLQINTKIIKSSDISIDHTLKAENKVIAMCKHLQSRIYINSIGGIDLYSRDMFNKNLIELKFLRSNIIPYKQFNNEFVPNLSILDVMMFNSVKEISQMLVSYDLI
jgi:hypothetical protein